jgi:predicted CoA-binding protein
MSFQNPDPQAIRALLERATTIAVVGYSPNPDRPSHLIAAVMQSRGYRILPVRPGIESGLGERAYPRLADVPDAIDIVDVFRSAEHVPGIVEECLQLKLPCLWLQDGVVHPAAAARAQAGGMMVVMNRCISRDYRMLQVGRA